MNDRPDNQPAPGTFVDGCDLLNRQITRALLLQPLVITAARQSTRAAAEIHEVVSKLALRRVLGTRRDRQGDDGDGP